MIGTAGVGGVLLVAFLALWGGLTIHQAAATALLSFAFTGVLGTWLFLRRGSLQWRIAAPVCVAAGLSGWAGAALAAAIDARPLTLLIALIILAGGGWILVPARPAAPVRDGQGLREQALLASVGAASGLGSGLSGAGGPLFSVPLMMALRYAPLVAVAAGQALQIVAATSGSIANLRNGAVDFRVAAIATLFELAGMLAGVRIAHAVSDAALRRVAGGLCLLSGGALLARAL